MFRYFNFSQRSAYCLWRFSKYLPIHPRRTWLSADNLEYSRSPAISYMHCCSTFLLFKSFCPHFFPGNQGYLPPLYEIVPCKLFGTPFISCLIKIIFGLGFVSKRFNNDTLKFFSVCRRNKI